ncbi:H-type small acid-soluble spore protein [Lederbergia wuyishanensis]|uniref:Small, acid-soluble spore protein H n=1 Tax=Lederbergia wuyishanensis TaxID=1347903 RepID=A0ABU0D5T0_9BACI|nr:H-type small acid-soluble spore protein [Lederbergia wuyishanensis]MCJ8008359.1 H-type small acid-soluble spore protein [Lederbergia wuyishanensis]MDQ0343773.1 small acid-soluble spore protein H (minor) [Lederbergia wuyishanensis]
MNIQRAAEIAESPDMKNVMYNGKPVYIQRVDDQNDTVRVFHLDNPENEFDVLVTNLIER